TLTNRDSMSFRMLLGRTAMDKQFIINPGASYLQGRPNADQYRQLPMPESCALTTVDDIFQGV
ncbi:MAG: hypothetical protein ACXWGW_19545, partial [Methylobacter sp.]